MKKEVDELPYKISIKSKDIDEAKEWCAENIGPIGWSQEGISYFLFDDEHNLVAFKLKFEESNRILVIDPPSGWQYGFPKEYNKKDDETTEEWLLNNGYPQKLIDQGMVTYCRYYESEID